MKAYVLSTIDNPYDPNKNYDAWLVYDLSIPHSASAYLARVAPVPKGFQEFEELRVQNQAIDDIIRLDDTGLYKRIELVDSEE